MKKTFLAATILSMLSFVACKPTESNYKAAYDAAQQKRQAAANDPDILLPSGDLRILTANETRRERRLRVCREAAPQVCRGLEKVFHKWNVAVAAYKMPTNCSAHVSELFSKGFKAFSAENPEGKFYVIA